MQSASTLARAEAASSAYAELREFFDRFASVEPKWRRRNRTYYRLIEAICRFHVPPGARVLEVGCGSGDLLAALRPGRGVGVDVSPAMIELARSRHPELDFIVSAGEELELDESFDYIVLSDIVPYVRDLLALFERVSALSHQRTRIVINSYSQLWRPLFRLGELLRLKARTPIRNWVAPEDVVNLLRLSGLELVTMSRRILFPKQIPLFTIFANGLLGSIWPLTHLSLTWWIIARRRPQPTGESTVSVICPCRNEQGNIEALVRRLPALGAATELIFVEGGSTDDTRREIERQIEAHPDRAIALVDQPGTGKGDAVRAGFAAAGHEVLVILDGDLSVDPEDLPKFYRAVIDGRGELINGSRLVYDLEPGAMRFLNLLGNKLFSLLLKFVLGQQIKDTLCGTKVLSRVDYEKIARERSFFGEFDPFGDFDLLLGAGRLGLVITDLPVRYRARAYGRTNISRLRHGLLLLRMTVFALWKFRVAVLRPR